MNQPESMIDGHTDQDLADMLRDSGALLGQLDTHDTRWDDAEHIVEELMSVLVAVSAPLSIPDDYTARHEMPMGVKLRLFARAVADLPDALASVSGDADTDAREAVWQATERLHRLLAGGTTNDHLTRNSARLSHALFVRRPLHMPHRGRVPRPL